MVPIPMNSASQAESQVIVVVDDDPTICEVICAILDGEGYQTSSFGDAASALSALTSSPPSLVLIDWLIRGSMNGEALFRAIKGSPETAALPILICTAGAHLLETASDLRESGVDVLPKPVELEDLLQTVARLVRT